MSEPPRDREELWIRFICSFLCFGFLTALLTFRHIDELGLAAGLAIWFMAVLSMSLYAARTGDQAWQKILNLLLPWR